MRRIILKIVNKLRRILRAIRNKRVGKRQNKLERVQNQRRKKGKEERV